MNWTGFLPHWCKQRVEKNHMSCVHMHLSRLFIIESFYLILSARLLFWVSMFLWSLVKRKTQSLKFVSLRLVLLHALVSREMTEPLVMLAGVWSSAQQHRLTSFPPHQSHYALCQSLVCCFEQLPQFIPPPHIFCVNSAHKLFVLKMEVGIVRLYKKWRTGDLFTDATLSR